MTSNGADSRGNFHDENGQFVSIATLFERERKEHSSEHSEDKLVAKETAQRLEREVEQTAQRLERVVEETAIRIEKAVEVALKAVAETARVHSEAHGREHTSHERIHAVEEKNLGKAAVEIDKRLDAMNEFRGALVDTQNKTVSRELFDATIKPLTEFRSKAMGAVAVIALVSGAIGAAVVRAFTG